MAGQNPRDFGPNAWGVYHIMCDRFDNLPSQVAAKLAPEMILYLSDFPLLVECSTCREHGSKLNHELEQTCSIQDVVKNQTTDAPVQYQPSQVFPCF